MIRSIQISKVALALLVSLASAIPACADPRSLFAPYLGNTPPKVVEIIDKKTTGSIEVSHLRFLSRTLTDGQKVIIYGILARPTASGLHPGILVCHGGGADADAVEPAVCDWAKRGYVAFCQDEPGIGPAKKSSGSWDKGDTWHCQPDATYCHIYDGVASALNGFNLLHSQPDVDPKRIGVTGGSWGGYLTLIVSSLKKDQVKAAFGVYGTGFYDKGTVFQASMARHLKPDEEEVWLENFDVGRIAKQVTAEYFLAAASCDWFFWPSSVQASFDEIQSPKNLAYSPNTSHALSFPGGNIGATPVDGRVHRAKQEVEWMDYYLQGKGDPFPACAPVDTPQRKGDGVRVAFEVKAVRPITEVAVWYSYGETPWRSRYWKKVQCQTAGAGRYEAVLPVEEPDYPLNWFGLVTDDRPVSASTVMGQVLPSKVGFSQNERKAAPWVASVQDADLWRIPTDRPKLVPGGSYVVRSDAFHGKPAIQITGNYALDCNGVRGVSLLRDKTAGLLLRVCSPGGTGFSVQVIAEGDKAYCYSWENKQDNPGTEWKEIKVRWDEFQPMFKDSSKKLLGERTAKIRFLTPPGANLLMGDVSTFNQ